VPAGTTIPRVTSDRATDGAGATDTELHSVVSNRPTRSAREWMSGITRFRPSRPVARTALMATASASRSWARSSVSSSGFGARHGANPIPFGVVTPSGSVYVPLTPNRVLDSRSISDHREDPQPGGCILPGDGPSSLRRATNVPAEAVGVTGNSDGHPAERLGYLSSRLSRTTIQPPRPSTSRPAKTGPTRSPVPLARAAS
jgi:hypothetical protein